MRKYQGSNEIDRFIPTLEHFLRKETGDPRLTLIAFFGFFFVHSRASVWFWKPLMKPPSGPGQAVQPAMRLAHAVKLGFGENQIRKYETMYRNSIIF